MECVKGIDNLDCLIKYFLNQKIEVIDKRNKGGALWIVAGKEFKNFFNILEIQGIRITYKENGGKASNQREAWCITENFLERKRQDNCTNFKSETRYIFSINELINYLEKLDIEIIDNRNKGGVLWIIYTKEIELFMKCLKLKGGKIRFLREGGKASNKRPSWYIIDYKI